jgi:hypothetical protein
LDKLIDDTGGAPHDYDVAEAMAEELGRALGIVAERLSVLETRDNGPAPILDEIDRKLDTLIDSGHATDGTNHSLSQVQLELSEMRLQMQQMRVRLDRLSKQLLG